MIPINKLLKKDRKLDVFDISETIKGNAVLVTGAGGSIGSELCLQLIAMKPSVLILYEMSEFALYQIDKSLKSLSLSIPIVSILGNLMNDKRLESIFKVFDVKFIFHAAAYKHVPLVEYNPIAAIENNVIGTKNLVDSARKCNVPHVILISTDKAVNPTNIMGATKRLAEYIALSGEKGYSSVRFGNVLWSTGSVLPLFFEQLNNGIPVTITDPEVDRYFMSIEEAVSLTLQSVQLKKSICVLDMGNPIKIVDIASRLADWMGKSMKIKYIGLRPGEKLHEELTLGECLKDTEHQFIKEAVESIPSFEKVSYWVKEMTELCNDYDLGGIRMFFKEIIPGYKPMCGIVDRVWLEKNVNKPDFDDCFSPAKS